ncbi:MAG: hypothetical protein JWL90_1980 [Chthoniobacteraceae bacterium]|nr:hypothetical protein [Chthoniobacteraceae bacterium]
MIVGERTSCTISAIISGLLCLVSANRVAFGALGEDPKKCNDRYGDLIETHNDFINNQNEIRIYSNPLIRTEIVFNDKKIAVEVRYSAKELTDAQISEFLLLNGADWKPQNSKLGTAIAQIKTTTWVTRDGKSAFVKRESKEGNQLHIAMRERINEMAEKIRFLFNGKPQIFSGGVFRRRN